MVIVVASASIAIIVLILLLYYNDNLWIMNYEETWDSLKKYRQPEQFSFCCQNRIQLTHHDKHHKNKKENWNYLIQRLMKY